MYRNPQELSCHKTSAGIGLPVAIFIITVLSLVVTAISDLGESSAVAFGQDLNSVRAFYAAESGAQIGLAKVFSVNGTAITCSSSPPVYGGDELEDLTNCTINVTCSSEEVPAGSGIHYYTFVSTATCGSGIDAAMRQVEVKAKG